MSSSEKKPFNVVSLVIGMLLIGWLYREASR